MFVLFLLLSRQRFDMCILSVKLRKIKICIFLKFYQVYPCLFKVYFETELISFDYGFMKLHRKINVKILRVPIARKSSLKHYDRVNSHFTKKTREHCHRAFWKSLYKFAYIKSKIRQVESIMVIFHWLVICISVDNSNQHWLKC